MRLDVPIAVGDRGRTVGTIRTINIPEASGESVPVVAGQKTPEWGEENYLLWEGRVWRRYLEKPVLSADLMVVDREALEGRQHQTTLRGDTICYGANQNPFISFFQNISTHQRNRLTAFPHDYVPQEDVGDAFRGSEMWRELDYLESNMVMIDDVLHVSSSGPMIELKMPRRREEGVSWNWTPCLSTLPEHSLHNLGLAFSPHDRPQMEALAQEVFGIVPPREEEHWWNRIEAWAGDDLPVFDPIPFAVLRMAWMTVQWQHKCDIGEMPRDHLTAYRRLRGELEAFDAGFGDYRLYKWPHSSRRVEFEMALGVLDALEGFRAHTRTVDFWDNRFDILSRRARDAIFAAEIPDTDLDALKGL